MIRGIIHQEGVNRIGTSSQGSSFVRIVLIQVRFLVVGRPEDFTHQLRDFYSVCSLVVPRLEEAILTSEAQKPGWQGGIAIRKVFPRPESFCA